MRKYSLVLLIIIVLTSGNDCFSQMKCLPKGAFRFNRVSSPFRYRIMTRPNTHECFRIPKDLDHAFSDEPDNVSEHNDTLYPLIILVALNQGDKSFFEKEKRVFLGPDLLNPYDLRQTLSDIFDKYEANHSQIQINIVHMDKDGFIELIASARKTEIDLSKPLPEPSSWYLPFDRYREIYPESAFDNNGNLSYWSYYGHTNFSFTNLGGGSRPSGLEDRVSYENNGKNQFIDDLVNYIFTWIEQDDKNGCPPLSPCGVQELKKYLNNPYPKDSADTENVE